MWIVGFKLLMGLLLTIFATGVLSFVHKDIAATVEHWVDVLHIDPDNRYIVLLLEKLGLVDDGKLRELGGLSFFYAGLLLTEGVGLMMKKRWAEYLTVIVTASLIPIEIHEVVVSFGFWKLVLLFLNVGIVWFLIRVLKGSGKKRFHLIASRKPASPTEKRVAQD